MLYNRQAVENYQPLTRVHQELAKKHSPFTLTQRVEREIRSKMRPDPKNPVRSVTRKLWRFFPFFLGTFSRTKMKTVNETWISTKGNCLEQNILLYSVLQLFGQELGFLMVKNPKGAGLEGNQIGYHLFLTHRPRNVTYLADAVHGLLIPFERQGFGYAMARMNFTEFVAHYLLWKGEEYGFHQDQEERGLKVLDLASRINPNDYTVHCSRGEIFYLMGEIDKAIEAYQQAIAIAPGLLDPHVEFLRMLKDIDEELFLSEAGKLSEKDSDDFSILRDALTYLKGSDLTEERKRIRQKAGNVFTTRLKGYEK